MATQKKKAASKTDKTVEFNEAAHHAREAKKPTKAVKPKIVKLDPALSAAKGVPTVTPKAKPARPITKMVQASHDAMRTVATPEIGLAGVPLHTVHDVAGLAKVLADFPRGSTYSTDIYQGMSWMKVYNLRGRLIAEIKRIDKPAKTAKK